MLFGVIYGLSNTKNATVGSAAFAFLVLGAITSAITIVYNAIANMITLPALFFWCFFLVIEVLWEVKAIRKIHKANVK